MKAAKLIKKLQEFPLDMEVCIFDIALNEKHASEEPSSEGVYLKISVYEMYDEGELVSLQCEFPNLNNFIALQFETEAIEEYASQRSLTDEEIEKGIREYYNSSDFLKLSDVVIYDRVKGAIWYRDRQKGGKP